MSGRATCANCARPLSTRWCLPGQKILARDLPRQVSLGAPGGPAGRAGEAPLFARNDLTVKEAAKQLIIHALKETNGNRTLAAKKVGMSRRTFHRKLHTYHLEGL